MAMPWTVRRRGSRLGVRTDVHPYKSTGEQEARDITDKVRRILEGVPAPPDLRREMETTVIARIQTAETRLELLLEKLEFDEEGYWQ